MAWRLPLAAGATSRSVSALPDQVMPDQVMQPVAFGMVW
jgi:hypothetical protein